MKKIVFFSGAGISAESGISTFRDQDGLWEQHAVEDVASIDGWHRNPELVNDFYNQRRMQLAKCAPNAAHLAIAHLTEHFQVSVITQNVDDLHERAGSQQVIHLHGELTKVCSERNKSLIEDIGYRSLTYGEKAKDGELLRPFIVWFGEAVPMMEAAIDEVQTADIFVIIGSSLNVYPAAGLYMYVPSSTPIYVIDPNDTQPISRKVNIIKEKATVGMKMLINELMK